MIDNLDKIKPLLSFQEKGEFYSLMILRRKKDQPEGEKENNQSVRTIKTYCIDSLEYLDKRYEEIKMLCEVFKARAYIHVQKQNHRDVSLDMSIALATRIKDGQYDQHNLFDSVVGQIKTYEKRWVVDVDTKKLSPHMLYYIEYKCRPYTEVTFDEAGMSNGYLVGPKIEAIIPTKNGHHLITKRFDTKAFNEVYPEVDIQKKNPTLLYYPNSLDA